MKHRYSLTLLSVSSDKVNYLKFEFKFKMLWVVRLILFLVEYRCKFLWVQRFIFQLVEHQCKCLWVLRVPMYKEDQCKFMWVLKFILQLGEYQCKAENDVGEALKTVTVAGRVHHHHTDDHQFNSTFQHLAPWPNEWKVFPGTWESDMKDWIIETGSKILGAFHVNSDCCSRTLVSSVLFFNYFNWDKKYKKYPKQPISNPLRGATVCYWQF